MSRGTMPLRSADVRWAPLGDGLLLHDERRHQVHRLNATGMLVWAACDGTSPVDEVVEEFAAASGSAPDLVAADVRTLLDDLTGLGLVGRPATPPVVDLGPDLDATGPDQVGPFRVLDAEVVLVGDDPALLDHLAELLADLRPGGTEQARSGAPPVVVAVHRAGNAVRVRGRGFDASLGAQPDVDEAVVAQLNRLVTWAPAPLAIHAGAVRSPDGAVVAVAGASGSGKSTLVAQLVQAGWDYLTDEALGLRTDLAAVAYPKPLALAPDSLEVLGLDQERCLVRAEDLRAGSCLPVGGAGRLGLVVVASYRPGGIEAHDLGLDDAVGALAPHVINLGPAGQAGIDVLADLLGRVPVVQLDHGGGTQVIDALGAMVGPA